MRSSAHAPGEQSSITVTCDRITVCHIQWDHALPQGSLSLWSLHLFQGHAPSQNPSHPIITARFSDI